MFEIGSDDFYAFWYLVSQCVHIVFFGALSLTYRWRAVAFPLFCSALLYVKIGSTLEFLRENGWPIESYLTTALVDTAICGSIVAIGLRCKAPGWARQAIILTLFSLIHLAAAVEYPLKGVTAVYSIYLPVTLFLNVLQVLVMYDSLSDLRDAPRTGFSVMGSDVFKRMFRSSNNSKGLS